MEQKKTPYKSCIVPGCRTTTKSAPDKIFFPVPKGSDIRRRWCEAMKRNVVSAVSTLYCCENHFDLEEDTDNYMKYKIMHLEQKQEVQLRLKKGTLPHEFHNNKSLPPPDRNPSKKKKHHQETIQEQAPPAKLSSKTTETEQRKDLNANASASTSFIYPVVVKTESISGGDRDGSPIFSWQIKSFVKEEEVLDGHWPDETETSLYQDQVEARVDNSALPDEDYTYRCNNCGENINGFRYTCVQCADWDLCGACEASAAHAAHYVLRVPSPRPYNETQAVLAAIRRQLFHDNVDSLKVDVKEEPGVTSEPQSEDDPLACGEIMQEEYLEEMTSETESIPEHQLPGKRPRVYSQSDQSVTCDVNDITESDDDIERPNVEPNADVWDRLHHTTEETALDDQTTSEVTKSLIESHAEIQGTTSTPHQELNEDSRNNTHWTDSNTLLHKRREVKLVPENQLKSKTRRLVLKIPPGVKVNAKDFVRQVLTDTATVRLTALDDRKRTAKLQETIK